MKCWTGAEIHCPNCKSHNLESLEDEDDMGVSGVYSNKKKYGGERMMESSELEHKNAEKDILAKAERYQKKSDALEVLLHTSRSARTFVMTGDRYYEFQYDEIPCSIVKHLNAFRDVLDIKVLDGNSIAVRIKINVR